MKTFALLAAVTLCALPTFAQENKVVSMLAKHWKSSKALTLAVADAMPESGYNSKPNPEEMTFGEQMAHIAAGQASYVARATGDKSPIAMAKGADKATAVKLLNESYDYCIKKLEALTDADLSKMVGPEGRQVMVAEAIWGGFTHTAHHRGQAEVYLRVKDLKPPAYTF